MMSSEFETGLQYPDRESASGFEVIHLLDGSTIEEIEISGSGEGFYSIVHRGHDSEGRPYTQITNQGGIVAYIRGDGYTRTYDQQGSMVELIPDGSAVVHNHNGMQSTMNPDGSQDVMTPAGQTIHLSPQEVQENIDQQGGALHILGLDDEPREN